MLVLRGIANRLPAPLRKFVYAVGLFYYLKEFKHLSSMEIVAQGDDDGVPYLELKSAPYRFYGYSTDNEFTTMYRLTSRDIRNKIDLSHYQLACDIALRYIGPDQNPLSQGKYYDLQAGDVVVEVGAYIGHYTMRVANLVGETGQVVAIEAMPENYAILEKNISANQLQQVHTIHSAVWHEPGTLTMHQMANQRASVTADLLPDTHTVTVPSDTLDNILASLHIEHVDFVRIQVNTAELAVLQGMEKTLTYGPRLLIAAPYQIDGRPASDVISEFLEARGYQTSLHGKSVFATKAT